MAGHARYTALLDACVLYPVAMTDALLSLATAGFFDARSFLFLQGDPLTLFLERLLANSPSNLDNRWLLKTILALEATSGAILLLRLLLMDIRF